MTNTTVHQMELEMQTLFGETSYHAEKKLCRGKYRGHSDYFLVFGSGRRLYVGLDRKNYKAHLQEHLNFIRYFRTHQEENTEKIKTVLATHNTPFCDASVEIVPYDDTNDLILYATVILRTISRVKFVYRETAMHYCLVGVDADWCSFEVCAKHMMEDICGKMSYTRVLV